MAFCGDRTIQLYCYAPACRRRLAWTRLLQSAPVYVCSGGCGTTREVHELGRRGSTLERAPDQVLVRAMRLADFSFSIADGRRIGKYRRADEPFAKAPSCGCCRTACLLVHDQVVRRCACDPHGATCIKCSRGLCHCRCSQPHILKTTQGDY